MGSFNQYCFASNQIITAGAKVRLLVIRRESSYSPMAISPPHSNSEILAYGLPDGEGEAYDHWEPIANTIPATYGDYGKWILDTNNMSQHTMLTLIELFRVMVKNCFVTKAGENQYHDLEFDIKSFVSNNAPILSELLNGPVELFSARRKFGDLDEIQIVKLTYELNKCFEYFQECAFKRRCFIANDIDVEVPKALSLTAILDIAAEELILEYEKVKDYDGNTETSLSIAMDALNSTSKVVGEFRVKLQQSEDTALQVEEMHKASGKVVRILCSGLMDRFRPNAMTYIMPYADEIISTGMNYLMSLVSEGQGISKEVAAQQLSKYVEGAQLMRALSHFGILIRTGQLANDDNQNDSGNEYLAALQRINKRVNTQIRAYLYGAPQTYGMYIDSNRIKLGAVAYLKEKAIEYDTYIEVMEINDLQNGSHYISIETSLDFNELNGFLNVTGLSSAVNLE